MTIPHFPLVGGQTSTPGTAVTFALTPSSDPDNLQPGDLHLLNGQLHFWDNGNARYQKCLEILQFFKGEWFLNSEEGVPYFQRIFIKNPDSRAILSIFRKALMLVPQAATVSELKFELDNATRHATVTWRLDFKDGTSVSSADYVPFIIPLTEDS